MGGKLSIFWGVGQSSLVKAPKKRQGKAEKKQRSGKKRKKKGRKECLVMRKEITLAGIKTIMESKERGASRSAYKDLFQDAIS